MNRPDPSKNRLITIGTKKEVNKLEHENELKLINMSDVEVTEVKWLWKPYIPIGKITIIQGDPGEGKTTMILQLHQQ